jgi:predicted NAD/FAD-dependent oxidoreductase
MLDAFTACVGVPLPGVTWLAAHRWGLARVAEGIGEECLFDPTTTLAVCGDWCPGSRVEDAFVSGIAAAGRIAGALRGT